MASSTKKRPSTDPKRWNRGNVNRQPSTAQKAIGLLPFAKKAAPPKRSSRGGTAGKAAMLTAAAGVAYKNRDKLTALLSKRRGQTRQPA
jgi:hypothetical protein